MTNFRAQQIERLKQQPEVSVLVVGGGVNGIGVFRDLALQGIDVLLVESGDFCSGASAASSHMAHGGVRYLENGEFRLVREAVQERNRLIENAPHQVRPLPTTIPIFKWFSGLLNAPLKFIGLLSKPAERGAIVIKFGLALYDWFTRKQGTVPRHQFAFRRQTLKDFPKLNAAILCAATYYDGLIFSPERVCVEMVGDAEAAFEQVDALNYVSAIAVAGDQLLLRDEVGGGEIMVKPKIVINAAGPWIDRVNQSLGAATTFIGGTKGSHLVLDNPALRAAIGNHEFFFENTDGRIVLILPLGERVMVGASDLYIDDPDSARCTEEEVDYFLGMVARVFPDVPVSREQIVFKVSGVRPLPASTAKTTGQVSRDHSIKELSADGLGFPVLSLVGGKWTSFRAFAEQVTDEVLQGLGQPRQGYTWNLGIGGGKDYPVSAQQQAAWVSALAQRHVIAAGRAETLFRRYGTQAEQVGAFISAQGQDTLLDNHQAYSRAEIAYLVQYEKVVHLDDLVLRRTMLAVLGELNVALLHELAELVGQVLGWPVGQVSSEVERCQAILQDRHGVELV